MKELDRGGHIIQYIQMTQKMNRSEDIPETSSQLYKCSEPNSFINL